jgi:hypothetical protein
LQNTQKNFAESVAQNPLGAVFMTSFVSYRPIESGGLSFGRKFESFITEATLEKR